MRTLNSSTININLNSSSSSASFDTPSSRSPAPALTSHPGRSAAPSNRSLSGSGAPANHNAKHPPITKPPRSPIAPTLQARARFSSAPVTASDSRSPPLGYHDHKQQQHVLALTTTTTRSSSSSAASSASKMPPGDSRPRPPPLSAAAAKTIGRTPLTPKIAAKGPSMAPPLTRRPTQNREDAFINSVTPRSGSRQNRAESTNTTPNGTPNLERGHDGWDPRASLTIDPGRQLAPADSPGDSVDSKFFYASEARPAQQPPPKPSSRPSSAAPKSATFFYANGATAEPKRAISPPVKAAFVPLLATPPEPAASKFFYASGTPEVSSKSSLQSSGPPSAGSSSSRAMNGRPSTSSSATTPGHSMPQRPMSPIKIPPQNPPAIIKNTTTPGLNSRPQITSPPPLTPSMTTNSRRRVSTESTPKPSRGHARTKSLMNLDSSKVSMSPPQQPSTPSSPPASPSAAHVVVTQPAMTMASILQAVEDFGEEEEEEEEDGSPEEVQSPTKATQSLDPVREVVANARRERKVQDLEITNASLEAINRTLERQLRKQTAEIRRFKRLSRLSLASAASSRVPSEALPSLPISLSDLSEEEESIMSEEEEPDSLDDSELSSAESASAADPLSPLADEKLVVRRKRDERRLQLDLTKHQELLVDSQKINQSLKRCLSWTEVLIKEGQKALEYTVRVSDVDFGGHVLAPADEEETSHLDEQLLKNLDIELDDVLEPPPSWEKSSQDRDSGIELRADVV